MVNQMISSNKYNPSLRPEWRFNRVLEMVVRITGNPGAMHKER